MIDIQVLGKTTIMKNNQNNKKKISIIIPCYQVEKYIDNCVNSLVNQTIGLDNLELIFINDASSDGTLDKLMHYENQYQNDIIVINCEENHKQGGARNIGLNYATGEYIGFVDADDWVETTMYEKLYNKAVTYHCDIVRCHNTRDQNIHMNIQEDRTTGKSDLLIEIADDVQREEFIASDLIGFSVWDKIYKKNLIFDNHITFPEKLAYEDLLWCAMFSLYVKRIYILEENLYHYDVNWNSTVLSMNQKYHLDLLTVNELKWEQYVSRGVLDKYKAVLAYDFIKTYYLTGLKMLFLRYSKVPYTTFLHMQNVVRVLIPDYHNNIYLKGMGEYYRLLVDTIGTDVSESEINQMAEIMRTMGDIR